MIKTKFEFGKNYRYAVYLRTSARTQSPHSLDQQLAMIREELGQRGYPWVEVKVYRDDAISGRYNCKRPSFQQMLSDIKVGKLQVDLILVDTPSRLGRGAEIAVILAQLQKLGVSVLDVSAASMDSTSMADNVMTVADGVQA